METRKMNEKKINLADNFIFARKIDNVTDFLCDLDLLVRVFSTGDVITDKSLENILNRKEEFSKAVTELVLKAVEDTLHFDTTEDDNPAKSKCGLFPKYAGEPNLTTFAWEIKQGLWLAKGA